MPFSPVVLLLSLRMLLTISLAFWRALFSAQWVNIACTGTSLKQFLQTCQKHNLENEDEGDLVCPSPWSMVKPQLRDFMLPFLGKSPGGQQPHNNLLSNSPSTQTYKTSLLAKKKTLFLPNFPEVGINRIFFLLAAPVFTRYFSWESSADSLAHPLLPSTMNTAKDGNTAHKKRSCYFSVVPSPATRTIWITYLTSKVIWYPVSIPSNLSGWTRLQRFPPGSTALRKMWWSQPSEQALSISACLSLSHTPSCHALVLLQVNICSFHPPRFFWGFVGHRVCAKREKVPPGLWGKLLTA